MREKLFEYVANQYGNWISALLDGSVDFDELCQWIDASYSTTN